MLSDCAYMHTCEQTEYGFGQHELLESPPSSPLQTAVFFLNVLLTPSAGIGYFIVFLIMQPNAYQLMKRLLYQCHRWICDGVVGVCHRGCRALGYSHSEQLFAGSISEDHHDFNASNAGSPSGRRANDADSVEPSFDQIRSKAVAIGTGTRYLDLAFCTVDSERLSSLLLHYQTWILVKPPCEGASGSTR
jgi:hypothetical protein